LDSRTKVFKFLRALAFQKKNFKKIVYQKGFVTYLKAKREWQKGSPGKRYPKFKWDKSSPGATACNLDNVWKKRTGV